MKKITKFIFSHKIISGIIIAVLVFGSYSGYNNFRSGKNGIKYVLAAVEKGTLTASVSGSGQVIVLNQVDIKSKVSGDILLLNVKSGDVVKNGSFLIKLDSSDTEKSVRDAEMNLASAKLSLEKLKKPTDNLALLQSENSLSQARESATRAEDDLKKTYEDSFNAVSDSFLDIPSVMSDLDDIFFESNINKNQPNISWYLDQSSFSIADERMRSTFYMNDLSFSYNKAKTAYQKNFDDYKLVSRNSFPEVIEPLIAETYETSRLISEAVRNGKNYVDFIESSLKQRDITVPATITTHKSKLDSLTSTTNKLISSLSSDKRSIENAKESVLNANRNVSERIESLEKLKNGPDALDLASQELSVQQRENALSDIKEKLNDYIIRAPFDGVIAVMDLKKGDSVSNGSSVVTIITKERLAEITLNEIDAARVKVGQKVTLSFDALPDLNITGKVIELDTVGAVSQGVVSYAAKVSFDADDERIKPGMSVSANIITDIKPDILLVPNSAVRQENGAYYVETSDSKNLETQTSANLVGIAIPALPTRQTIEIGAANDEFTEIISGLNESDVIVTARINPQTNGSKATTNGQSSSVRIPGLSGSGGGGNRSFGR